MILTTILNWLSGGALNTIASKATEAYVAAKTSQTEIDKAALASAVEAGKIELERMRIDAGNGWTRAIRPLCAYPFILYWSKLLVVDKVLGPGLVRNGWDPVWFSTDPLSPELTSLGATVVAFYFGGRTIELVASKLMRR